jgi:tetratricopeptide (TPR) repeat protein
MVPKRWKKIFKKNGLVFIGVIFFFFILETGLRFGGFFLLSLQNYRNIRALREKPDITILCLGESTTREGMRKDGYPSFLEETLNKRHNNKKFAVINKGIDGTNTSMILSRLPYYINKYNPDIVISMIGINDGVFLEAAPYPSNPDKNGIISSLKIYKLFLLFRNHFRASFVDKDWKIYSKKQSPQIQAQIDLATYYRKKGKFSNMKRILKKAIKQHPDNDRLLIELGIYHIMQNSRPKAKKYFQQVLELNPKNKEAYLLIAQIYRSQGRYTEANKTIKKAIKKIPEDSQLKETLAYYTHGIFHHLPLKNRPMLTKNYPRLANTLINNNIILIAVQYPVRPLNFLKEILPDSKYIYFVDNESIFKDAINKKDYWYYFTDRFGENFGHMTEEGNRLLAGNIAKLISKKVIPEFD